MRTLKHIIACALTIAAFSCFGQNLSLDSCLHLALKNNAKVRNAELDVEAAKEVKRQAFTKYFPQVSAIGIGYHAVSPLLEYGINDIDNAGLRNLLNLIYTEYGQALGFPRSISLLDNGAAIGHLAVQPLFMGGQIVNGNRLAKVGVEAAELQSQLAGQEALLQTEESYWLVISLQEKEKTINQAQELLDTLYKDVTAANSAGLLLKNDVLKVTLKRNELLSNKLKVENGLVLAKSALCQSIGLQYDTTLTLTDTLGEIYPPSSIYSETDAAVAKRDETKLLELNLKAEKLKKKKSIGATLPQFIIGYGGSYGNLLTDKWSYKGLAFATMKIPLTAWWEASHKLKEHDIRIEQAQNTYNDLTEKMSLQTHQAWNELTEAYTQIDIADETVAAAAENLKIAADNFHAGLVPLSELLEAETLHRQAVDQSCDAKIAYKIKMARYRILVSAE